MILPHTVVNDIKLASIKQKYTHTPVNLVNVGYIHVLT